MSPRRRSAAPQTLLAEAAHLRPAAEQDGRERAGGRTLQVSRKRGRSDSVRRVWCGPPQGSPGSAGSSTLALAEPRLQPAPPLSRPRLLCFLDVFSASSAKQLRDFTLLPFLGPGLAAAVIASVPLTRRWLSAQVRAKELQLQSLPFPLKARLWIEPPARDRPTHASSSAWAGR